MKPSEAFQLHRAAIRRIVENNDACNPRVFGSVLHGDDTDDSDIDILVDPIDGRTSLMSLVRIKRELEQILGVKADIQTPFSLHERFRGAILSEAVSV
jgi:predicted nucleotidyltransferase